MRYGVLGPVELHHEAQPVPLAGLKQRRLLAVLLLNRGRVVAVDRLVDALWGDRPPVDAPAAVQVHVSRLRAVLRSAGAPDPVRTRSNGYLLEVPADDVDLDRFRVLVAQGDDDLAHGRPEQAARAATEALALWKGAPLADVQPAGRPWPELDGVEELRRAALGVRFDAEPALGRGETLVGELRTLLAEDPLRERTRGQLMLALARSGRRAEALELYRDGRELSVDRLGGWNRGRSCVRCRRRCSPTGSRAPVLDRPSPGRSRGRARHCGVRRSSRAGWAPPARPPDVGRRFSTRFRPTIRLERGSCSASASPSTIRRPAVARPCWRRRLSSPPSGTTRPSRRPRCCWDASTGWPAAVPPPGATSTAQ